MDVTDGQTIALGDTTVTLALTPGHTPGTIAMLFPAKHRGRTHTAMLFGGTQGPTAASIATFEHVFNDFARKQNAESALGSHPGILMNTLPLMEKLQLQYPTGAHPLLMGPERFGRYLSIMLECGKARLAAMASASATATADGQRPSSGVQAAPAPGETLSQSYRGSQSDNVAYQKVPPIKVFDNLYYVGPGSVSVWLIPTTDGLILIDSAQEPLVDHVIDSIRKAGFDPRNVKYILLTHGHLDHFGGAGKLKALSGARIGTLEEDWQLIDATYQNPNPGRGRGNARDNGVPFTRDLVIKEGDTITLGKTSLKVYKLPGHTPGSASFEFTVYDNGTPHKAFIFGGPGQRNGVEGGTQFLESIRRLKREQADVEVPIHVHSYLTTYPWPEGGAVFEPAIKLAQRRPGQPHPFVNNTTWRQWLDTAEAGTIKYIEDAKAGRIGGRGQTQ
jgi:metallo-beta-lactamase class B